MPATLGEIPAYVDKAIPILDAGVKEIRALRPPENMEQGVDDWLASTSETREGRSRPEEGRARPATRPRREGGGLAGRPRSPTQRHAKARALGLTPARTNASLDLRSRD